MTITLLPADASFAANLGNICGDNSQAYETRVRFITSDGTIYRDVQDAYHTDDTRDAVTFTHRPGMHDQDVTLPTSAILRIEIDC